MAIKKQNHEKTLCATMPARLLSSFPDVLSVYSYLVVPLFDILHYIHYEIDDLD